MKSQSIRAERALSVRDRRPGPRVLVPAHTAITKAAICNKWPSSAPSTARRQSSRMLASATDISDVARRSTLGDAGDYNAVTAAPGQPSDHTIPLPARGSMEGAIQSFFDAFNERDLQKMADAVAEDVEHCNLAYAKPYPKGKQPVVAFYKKFVDAVPRSAKFVIEDTTGTNSSGTIGVIWHLEIRGTVVPNSSGVSFFRLDNNNRITYVRESPEHFTKITGMALPTLSMISPILSLAEPLMRGRGESSSSSSPPPTPSPSSTPPHPQPSTPSHSATSSPVHTGTRASLDAASAAGGRRSGRRGSDVAMRPLVAPSDEDDGSVPRAVVDMQPDLYDSEPSEAVQRTRTRSPVLASARGLEPRVHNGCKVRHTSNAIDAADAPVATEAPGEPMHAQAQAPQPLQTHVETPRLAGVWQKDQSRCDKDGYGRALDLMGLGGIQKATAMGLEGMEVKLDEASGVFETFFLTPVPFFKVRERFVLGGVESKQSRRDLRGGQQVGKAWLREGRIVTQIAWGPKQAGTGQEEFWVDENGQLNVKSTVTVNGQSSTTIQVYTRQDGGNVDSRYYAPKREIPFGIDPNTVSEGLLGNFLK